MRKKIFSVVLLLFAVLSCSCTRNEEPASNSRTDSTPKGRAETRVVEALDAVGYGADKVRKSLDRTLDAADEKKQRMQDLLEE